MTLGAITLSPFSAKRETAHTGQRRPERERPSRAAGVRRGPRAKLCGPRDSGGRTASVLARVLTFRFDQRLKAFDDPSLREFLACCIALDSVRIANIRPCRFATPKPLPAIQTRASDCPSLDLH